MMIGRTDIEAAHERIRPHVRATPVLDVAAGSFGVDHPLTLKLELFQHAGSFKPRGAFNNLLSRGFPKAGVVAASGGTVNVVDPLLMRPYDHANPDFKPAPGSPALTMGFEIPPNDGFFDTTVTYRGALSANPAEDWTVGWTNYAQN